MMNKHEKTGSEHSDSGSHLPEKKKRTKSPFNSKRAILKATTDVFNSFDPIGSERTPDPIIINANIGDTISHGEIMPDLVHIHEDTFEGEVIEKSPIKPEAKEGVIIKAKDVVPGSVTPYSAPEPKLAESTQPESEERFVMTEKQYHPAEPVISSTIPDYPLPEKKSDAVRLEELKQIDREITNTPGPDEEILKADLEAAKPEELASNEALGLSARNKTLEKELPSLRPTPTQEVLESVSKVTKEELLEEYKKKNIPPSETEIREKVALARRSARYAAANTYFNRYDWLKKSLEDALNSKDIKKAEESLRLLQEQDLRKEAKRLYDEADRIYWTEIDPRKTEESASAQPSPETLTIPPRPSLKLKEIAGPDAFSYKLPEEIPQQDVFSMNPPLVEKARTPRNPINTAPKGIPPSAPEFQKPIPQQPQKRSLLNRWTFGIFGK
ncbi:MAG TPA: hypothetical protein PLF31_02065 [Candidatus Paceibacterota bacterium]|nr:hypothetical protein [Candidatus Paceibacterota bacterium]